MNTITCQRILRFGIVCSLVGLLIKTINLEPNRVTCNTSYTTHKSVPQSRNDFWSFSVGERGLMVILSSDITVDVRDVSAGDNTT